MKPAEIFKYFPVLINSTTPQLVQEEKAKTKKVNLKLYQYV